jgi:hypothetical protein
MRIFFASRVTKAPSLNSASAWRNAKRIRSANASKIKSLQRTRMTLAQVAPQEKPPEFLQLYVQLQLVEQPCRP